MPIMRDDWVALLRAYASLDRDALVIGAFAAGVRKNQIAKITGISRTTVDRIVAPIDERRKLFNASGDDKYCPSRDSDGIHCEKERGHEPPCLFID